MIHRIDVRATTEIDPLGESVRHQITQFGPDVGPITSYRIFLIDSDANATSFVVTALNQAGQTSEISDLNFEPTDADTYTLNFNQGFQCPNPPCNTTLFEFRVTVTDADAQTSPFAGVDITSR